MPASAFSAPISLSNRSTRSSYWNVNRCVNRRPRYVKNKRREIICAADEILRTLSANGEVSARVILGTDLVTTSAEIHQSSAVATTALGRALLCTLLLNASKPAGETIQIQFRGNGPLGSLTAIASGPTHVRGYVDVPQVLVPPKASGELNVAGAIGRGVLAVVRTSKFSKSPYTGLVSIASSEVAEDVAHYLSDSEQIPSAISAGVRLKKDGGVECAAGFLVQLLPGASQETTEILERNVKALPQLTDMFANGASTNDVMQKLMKDLEPMETMSSVPEWKCSCDIERLKRTISLLPKKEVEEVLEKEKKIEAVCEFCNRKYSLSKSEVALIIN